MRTDEASSKSGSSPHRVQTSYFSFLAVIIGLSLNGIKKPRVMLKMGRLVHAMRKLSMVTQLRWIALSRLRSNRWRFPGVRRQTARCEVSLGSRCAILRGSHSKRSWDIAMSASRVGKSFGVDVGMGYLAAGALGVSGRAEEEWTFC